MSVCAVNDFKGDDSSTSSLVETPLKLKLNQKKSQSLQNLLIYGQDERDRENSHLSSSEELSQN
jgi:hypothetical protein